jgi:PEGA domain
MDRNELARRNLGLLIFSPVSRLARERGRMKLMKMRGVLLVGAVVLAMASVVTAQQQLLPPLPPPPVSLAVPHPIPPMSNPPPQPYDLYRRLTPPPWRPGPIVPPSYVYGPSPYVPYGYAFAWSDYMFPSYESLGPLSVPPPPAIGWLRFEATPGDAQVLVDGYHVGQVEDFGMNGQVLDLDAGVHRVEMRAPGYAPTAFEVNVIPNQSIRYRGDLQRLMPPPAAAVAPAMAKPRPIYVIPNCYAGTTRPVLPLPAGCDIKRLQTRN